MVYILCLDDQEEDIMKAFSEAVKEEIAKYGEITRKLAHSIFIGPPGSGKSSLIYFLLNGKPKEGFSPSTGTCNPIVMVDINQSTLHPAILNVDCDAWSEVTDYKLSLLLQMTQKSLPTSPDHNNTKSESFDETDIDFESEEDADFRESNPAVHIPKPNIEAPKIIDTASNISSTFIEEPDEMPGDIDIFDIIKKDKYKIIKNYLKQTSSLYLRDTGGHIEFQEMMPLTIFGPSIFFFVFNASQDFHDTFDIRYRKSSSESLNPYRSSLTIEDALLQCLASIRAVDVPSEDNIKTHKSVVFIIGTHIDQIKNSISDKMTLLNQQIHSLVVRNNFRDLVQYCGEKDHVIFPVDNFSSSDEHFKVIRSKVSSLIWGHEDFNIKFPTTYLLVCIQLQNEKKSILSVHRFKDIAARWGIKGDKVFHLLRFLHFRVGVVRYYDVPGLRDIVVVQPQILFSTITDLVIQTYSSECLYPDEKIEFKEQGLFTTAMCERILIKKGIFPSSTIEESIIRKGDTISPGHLLDLLEHLRIITPFFTPGDTEKKYFIPFVLNHVPESGGDNLITTISPLVIKFECCHDTKTDFSAYHCPKGVFGVLITYLMNPDSTDQITSSFSLVQVFKNQVLLKLECSSGEADQDKISLRYCCSHLEITFYPDASDDIIRNLPIGFVCQSIREIVVKSILRSLKHLHYSTDKIKPVVCFKCKNEDCSEKHKISIHARGGFPVYFCKKTDRLPEEARCWYNEGKCINQKLIIVYIQC